MTTSASPLSGKTYIVEHLDPELGPWSTLEYLSIARETTGDISSISSNTGTSGISAHDLEYQKQLSRMEQDNTLGLSKDQRAAHGWSSLLPSQFHLTSMPESLQANLPEELEAARKQNILQVTGESVEKIYEDPELKAKVCLLDPAAKQELNPEDGRTFDVFLFGGILGT
jgi:ribosome biogenesis SPOUT family RNA methylase Rps3